MKDEFGEAPETFTPEEFLEFFGYEPERFASEMDFDWNWDEQADLPCKNDMRQIWV